MRLLGKLRPLKTDMEEKGWVIESFRFKFKGTNYIVLVILYEQGEPRPQYALVQLDFLHPKNFNHHLLVPANTFRLLADAMDIRIFFRIQYSKNLGDVIQQLTSEIGDCIPEKVNTSRSKEERKAMIYRLSEKDSEDSEKVFCYAVKRNPVILDKSTGQRKQAKRTDYNDNKTRLLRGSLYRKLGKDDTISFCYSDDPEMDYPDEVIIANWLQKKEKGQALLLF